MLVSVLMSTYNNEATLPAAIDSILAQTLDDFELILCNDASSDGTWDILCRYCERDPRIRIFQNRDNIGLAASLNRCLGVAAGEYIARQDADDVSDPERLERTLAYLQRTGAPYVGCGVYVFDRDGVWSRRLHPEQITRHIIAKKNPFFHPTMVFRRGILEQVGGYRVAAETRRAEDYDLVMRLAGRGIIGRNLQEYLYYVNEPPEAYSRRNLRTRWHELVVRLYGLRQMRSPLWEYCYLCRPVIMCMVPRCLLRQLKRLQWKSGQGAAYYDITVE